MGLRMKNMGITKKSNFLGKVYEKPMYRGEQPKKWGALAVCRFSGGMLGEKEGVVFLKRGKLGTTQARNSTVLLLLCVAASRPSELDSVKKCAYLQVQWKYQLT